MRKYPLRYTPIAHRPLLPAIQCPRCSAAMARIVGQVQCDAVMCGYGATRIGTVRKSAPVLDKYKTYYPPRKVAV